MISDLSTPNRDVNVLCLWSQNLDIVVFLASPRQKQMGGLPHNNSRPGSRHAERPANTWIFMHILVHSKFRNFPVAMGVLQYAYFLSQNFTRCYSVVFANTIFYTVLKSRANDSNVPKGTKIVNFYVPNLKNIHNFTWCMSFLIPVFY